MSNNISVTNRKIIKLTDRQYFLSLNRANNTSNKTDKQRLEIRKAELIF